MGKSYLKWAITFQKANKKENLMIEKRIGPFVVMVSTSEMKGHHYVTFHNNERWASGMFFPSEKLALLVAEKKIAGQLEFNKEFGGTLNAPDYW